MKAFFTDLGIALMWAYGLIQLGAFLFRSDEMNWFKFIVIGLCLIIGSYLVYTRIKNSPKKVGYKTDQAILDVVENDQCKQD